jgi:uncharacterized membrane protein YjjP (DUF1212 family)
MTLHPPEPQHHRATQDDVEFVLELARGLHEAGTPSHRLEGAIERIGIQLGLEMHISSTPTAFFIGFGHPARQRLTLSRVQPGSVGLERLEKLDHVVSLVGRGELTPKDGAAAVHSITSAPERYGPALTLLAYTLSSTAAGRIFDGGWREMVAASVIGLLIGVLTVASRHSRRVVDVVEPVGALTASLVAASAGLVLGRVSPMVVTLAGVITLLPGLTLTTAMSELATRNLTSGTARLFGAGATFMTLGLGVGLGSELADLLPHVDVPRRVQQLPEWTEWVALVVLPLASVVHLRAMPRQIPAMLGAGILAYTGARLGAHVLGPEFGAFAAALLLGTASNAYARILDRPASVLATSGILMLVPGSIGFRSMSSMMQNDVVHGMQTAMSMLLVAVSLAGGLLFANVVVPPRRAV